MLKVRAPDGSRIDTGRLGAKAAEQLAAAMAGNDVDPEQSAQVRMAENASAAGEVVTVLHVEDHGTVSIAGKPEITGNEGWLTEVKPLDPSWFYDLSPAMAAVRACHELIKRGLTPYDFFKIVSETVLPQMNDLTRAEAGKLAGVLSRKKMREAA